jgi:hypothetical protein
MRFRARSIDLNRRSHKLYGPTLCNQINDSSCYMLESAYPINAIMWCQQSNTSMEDLIISVFNMRYVEYSDNINKSTLPFKKR